MRKTIVAMVMGGYLLVLLDLTLVRFPQPGAAPNWLPFVTIAHYWQTGGWELVRNVLGNLALFAPLGFLLPALHGELRSAFVVTTFSLAVSLAIESLQYASGQRVADVDDVVLNTLGGCLGYVAYTAFRQARVAQRIAHRVARSPSRVWAGGAQSSRT